MCFLLGFYICSILLSGYILPTSLKKNLIYTLGGNGHMFTRLSEVKERKNIDILFLGSSRSYRSFDTRIYDSLGYLSFNLGSSNQTPIQTEYLLKKYLPQLNPKIVVFEVNTDVFSNNGVESAIDLISNEKINYELLKMVLQINNIKLYNTLVFSFFNQRVGNFLEFKENIENEKDKYTSNGFVEAKKNEFDENKVTVYNCTSNSQQMEAFHNIIRILKEFTVEFYLVQSPILKSVYDSCTNNKFDSEMKTYKNYINFNEFSDYSDKQYFIDGQHLNQTGVQKFNKTLIDLIF